MLITRAVDWLKPGGVLLYKDMADRPRWQAWANVAHDLVFARQYSHIVPFSLIASLAEAEGLVLEKHVMLPIIWYGHEFAVFQRPAEGAKAAPRKG